MNADCAAEKNEVDSVLDGVESDVSIARGKGRLTEDKYNEIIEHIHQIRNTNNTLKCLIFDIPEEKTSPENILGEIKRDE